MTSRLRRFAGRLSEKKQMLNALNVLHVPWPCFIAPIFWANKVELFHLNKCSSSKLQQHNGMLPPSGFYKTATNVKAIDRMQKIGWYYIKLSRGEICLANFILPWEWCKVLVVISCHKMDLRGKNVEKGCQNSLALTSNCIVCLHFSDNWEQPNGMRWNGYWKCP